jgi:hypothetical protein
MAIFGGAVALPAFPRAVLWGAAACVFAGFSEWRRPETATAHSAVFLFAAAACGLGGAVVGGFLGAPEAAGEFPAAAAAGVAASAGVAALAFRGAVRADSSRRALRLLSVSVAAAGIGAAAVALAARAGSAAGTSHGLATVRMSVLCASIVFLSALARGRGRDLRYLVYAALAIAGVKLLFDDLPRGTPAGRFAAFALYGLALLAAPRLLKASGRAQKSVQVE